MIPSAVEVTKSSAALEMLGRVRQSIGQSYRGILEFYSRRHIAARIDLGDTVWYGSGIVIPAILSVGGSVVPGTSNQLPWNIGVSVWF